MEKKTKMKFQIDTPPDGWRSEAWRYPKLHAIRLFLRWLLGWVPGLYARYAETIIDISLWQSTSDDSRLMDFDTYEQSDGIMCIIKASQGDFSDRRYSYYLSELVGRGLPRGSYHFADARYPAKAAAQLWAAQIASEPPIPDWMKPPSEVTYHWFDVENYGFQGVTKDAGRAYVREFLDEMDRLLPDVRIGIYTSYYGWKDNISPMDEIHERDLWVANYGVSEPAVPDDWARYKKTWLLWQTCDSCSQCGGCGAPYGAASVSIDTNVFNGSMDNFMSWISKDAEPPEPDCCAELTRWRALSVALAMVILLLVAYIWLFTAPPPPPRYCNETYLPVVLMPDGEPPDAAAPVVAYPEPAETSATPYP